MSQVSTQKTYYDILEVSSHASQNEIRTAFRELAKRFHPDKNPRRVSWAETKMHELLGAYRALSDDRRRFVYDRQLRSQSHGASFVERMKRRKDAAAQSRLVLHYLLEGDFDRAVELHEQMVLRRATFSLAHHLNERDYLDSLFLLGEAYEERHQWHTAARYYWEAYEREHVGPRKRYFFEEVKDRLRVLFSQRLVRGLAPEDALKNYRRALDLGIGNRDAALIYKKIAAVQNRLGRRTEAVRALDEAKRLCPGMKSIETLRKRIAGH